MATISSGAVLLDPWTAAVAAKAAKRGQIMGVDPPTERSDTGVDISSRAPSTAERLTSTTVSINSIASKFNLPQPNVLHVLRTAYFSAVVGVHKQLPTTGKSATPAPLAINSHAADENIHHEGRETKRLKSAGLGCNGESLFGTASHRGAAALKRLCAALGVYTQQEHMPAQKLSYAVASSKGWRVAMEDTYAAEVPLKGAHGVSLFAVYDGHGGAEVARYSALHMGRAIRDAPSARAAFGPLTTAPPAGAGAIDVQAATGGPASATVRSCGTSGAVNDLPSLAGSGTRRSVRACNVDESCDGGGRDRGGGGTASPAHRSGPGPPPRPGSAPMASSSVPSASEAAAGASAAEATLREAFLSLDRQLADEAHSEELMALANPGALTVPPEAYGRRGGHGPFLGPAAGSTATVALVGQGGVTVASVGDSRCILGSRAGGVVVMSVDHKASDEAERERVVRAGCWVSASGRVCGELDMSRALGDADMKQAPGLPQTHQAVTADPTARHVRLVQQHSSTRQQQQHLEPGPGSPRSRTPGRQSQSGSGTSGGDGGGEDSGGSGDLRPSRAGSAGGAQGSVAGREQVAAADTGGGGEGGDGGSVAACGRSSGGSSDGDRCYLLIASDGLWNVLDNGKVHDFVMERLEARVSPEAICAQLCIEACVSERTAYDNVTVLLVLLHGVMPFGSDVAGEEHGGEYPSEEAVAAGAVLDSTRATCSGGEGEGRRTHGMAICTAAASPREPEEVGQVEVQVEEGLGSSGGTPGARGSGQPQSAGSGSPSAWQEGAMRGEEPDMAVAPLGGRSAHWAAVALGDATCRVRNPGSCSGGIEEVQGEVCCRQREVVVLSCAQSGGSSDAEVVVVAKGSAASLERFDGAGDEAIAGLNERLLEASPMQEDASAA